MTLRCVDYYSYVKLLTTYIEARNFADKLFWIHLYYYYSILIKILLLELIFFVLIDLLKIES